MMGISSYDKVEEITRGGSASKMGRLSVLMIAVLVVIMKVARINCGITLS